MQRVAPVKYAGSHARVCPIALLRKNAVSSLATRTRRGRIRLGAKPV